MKLTKWLSAFERRGAYNIVIIQASRVDGIFLWYLWRTVSTAPLDTRQGAWTPGRNLHDISVTSQVCFLFSIHLLTVGFSHWLMVYRFTGQAWLMIVVVTACARVRRIEIRARGDEDLQVQSGLSLIVTGWEKNGEIGEISRHSSERSPVSPIGRLIWFLSYLSIIFRSDIRIKYVGFRPNYDAWIWLMFED